MKNIMRSIIIIFFMFLALGLSGFLSYQVYKTYKTDQIIQKSDVYIVFLEHIDTIVLSLEKEQLLSALYIGYGGKTDFHKLELVREKNDALIKNLELFLEKNPDILSAQISSEDVRNNLQYVRSRVDVVNSGYQDILFEYYHKEIIKPFLASSSALIQKLLLGVAEYKQPLKAYSDLQMYRNDLSLEEGFVAFLLSRSEKIAMHDLVLWEEILSDQKISLSRISDLSESESKLLELRVAVLKGVDADNAKGAISVTTWLEKMDALINEVIRLQQDRYKKLQKGDYKKATSSDIYLKLIFAFLALLGFFRLFFLLRVTKKPVNPKILQIENKPHINEAPIQLKNSIATFDDDLPLSNIDPNVKVEKSVDFELNTVHSPQEFLRREDKTFYALKEFSSLIQTFITDTDNKDIDFHYDIDPNIPEICIGDIDKIKQFLEIFLQYAIDVTPSKELVVLQIENIAQKKFESAINFTIKDSGRFINDAERKKIKRGVDISPDRDLSLASRLIFLLGGRLDITSNQDKGNSFSVTLNLKKVWG